MLGVKKKESPEGYAYHIETNGSKEPGMFSAYVQTRIAVQCDEIQ